MATRAAQTESPATKLNATMRIVVLHGKDAYLLRENTRLLRESLERQHGEIEQFSFDGATVAPATVLDELRSYGLIQRHKLVIVDNADVFLAGGKGAEDPGDDADADDSPSRVRPLMEKYAKSPVDEATLLMRAETWRPGNFDKLVSKAGTIIKCDPPTEDKAVAWCIGRCERRYDCTIDRPAAALLVTRIGPDLARLDMELQKLAALVGPAGTIRAEEVRQMVQPSREEKAWEIQSAILTGRQPDALGKLKELLEISRQPYELLMWSISDLLRKLHGAAQLLRQGRPEHAIGRELKLWGSAASQIVSVAGRLEPDRLAHLLGTAVDLDMKAKSGGGDQQRSLEALTILVTDTISCR